MNSCHSTTKLASSPNCEDVTNSYPLNEGPMQTAHFNRFSLDLPAQCVADCSHQGDCFEDTDYWAQHISMPATPEAIRAELAEYGAWSTEELADDNANIRRLLWCAACNIKEEQYEAAREAKRR